MIRTAQALYDSVAQQAFWLYWGPASVAIIMFAGWMRQPD